MERENGEKREVRGRRKLLVKVKASVRKGERKWMENEGRRKARVRREKRGEERRGEKSKTSQS